MVADKGVGGAELSSDSAGTKFERTRMMVLGGGGPALIALEVAGRAGGGGGGVVPLGRAPCDLPGDAVCALGGGGGCVGFALSGPAALFTQRFCSLS